MLLVNLDLAGAEWVIVAYLSQDKNMMEVVKSGKSPHVITGSLITGISQELVLRDHKLIGEDTDADSILLQRRQHLPELLALQQQGHFLPRTMSIRQAGKKSNHALNYGMRYKRFAQDNEVPEADAKPLCEKYSTVAYPGLQDYWDAVRQKLRADRTLTNCFGRKVTLMEEWGPELFMAGYSFEPQSTVADCTIQGVRKSYYDLDPAVGMHAIRLGAQVHDSILFQYPENDLDGMAHAILRVREHMTPEMTINGHTFRLGCDVKIGRNWGRDAMKEVKVSDNDPAALKERLRETVQDLP